ncbi:MAG: hypothetical protein PHH12_03485 [Candidatus Shapirobacteria bacterium]|jgi:8-oxo-dGTP pyrophosphatase MutT (NUDIX family)|nr:hypothetical protein [Candidatus Shapirobacteria bacterium]
MKVFSSVVLKRRNLYLTTASEEVAVAERKKKTGTPDSIWSESFAKMAGKEGEWIEDGKLLRAGISVVVLVPIENGLGVILNRFDAGHPIAAGKLSTPAGIWEGKQSLLDSALSELGEEVIIADRECGFWTYKGQLLAEEWVKEYAFSHGMKTVDFKVEIYSLEVEGNFEIYLDGEYQGNALLAYEPETGGIEILFVFETFVSVNGMIVDGERFKDQWLDREVGVYTLEQLLNEDKKTSKVETVELFLQSMLL